MCCCDTIRKRQRWQQDGSAAQPPRKANLCTTRGGAAGGRRAALLKLEEDWIEGVCTTIASFKPDVVVTEKGLSDLAMHFLTKAGISAIRRLRKTGATPRSPKPPPGATREGLLSE